MRVKYCARLSALLKPAACLACCIVLVAGCNAQKLDQLIVYGDGFAFSAKTPTGWVSDIDRAAGVGANVLFYRATETFENAAALIRIRLNDKVDESTAADLQYDMDGYKQRHPDIEFRNLEVSHPNYAVHAKLFTVPNRFYEYTVYLNPGQGIPHTFSVAMYKSDSEATAEEMAAFRDVVGSVVFLTAPEASETPAE